MARILLTASGWLVLGIAGTAGAQGVQSPPAPTAQSAPAAQTAATVPAPPAPAAPAAATEADEDFVLPDIPSTILIHETDRYWVKPILAVVADYTFFEQNNASLAQVGKQGDTRDLRAARMGVLARSKSDVPWEINFTVDYQEGRTREDQYFQLYDLRFRLPFDKVTLDFGKQKQPFVFEVVGLSILNPQQERILNPFFVTRSIGAAASGQLAGDRMTWSAGWFNDWLESDATFSDNANDFVARLTGLALASNDDRDYLHLGIGMRRVGPDAGTIQLSGRPESNVADRYVDTGEFLASHVYELAFEIVWDRGPFMVLAEHIEAKTESPETGNPQFSGSYLTFSWMLTGESRAYLRRNATTGQILPNSHRGAIEIVARYSHIDLTDALIDGGVLDKWHLGANWWSSRQWKAGISYGDADLNRFGSSGNTRMMLMRLQWYY